MYPAGWVARYRAGKEVVSPEPSPTAWPSPDPAFPSLFDLVGSQRPRPDR